MSPFVLEELVPAPPKVEVREADPVPSFLEIGTGYRPGRSFGMSVVVHGLAWALILASSTHFAFVHAAEVVPPDLQSAKNNGPLFLPTLGGGSEGDGQSGGGAGSTAPASTGLRARSHRGFAYPGKQPLVSAPPMAKLGIQTILQPMLKNAPMLTKTYPLPNLAIAPPPTPAPVDPPKPVMKVQNGRVAIRPAEAAVRAPKITLPVAATSEVPKFDTAAAVMPQAPPPKPVPAPARTADVPVNSRGKQGLLVLNAIPPPPDTLAKVPLGEARSLFAVAPGESTVIAAPSAGTKSGGESVKAAGNGTPSDTVSGDAIADVPSGGGSGMGSSGSGVGTGGKYGTGSGKGLNSGTDDVGSGRGSVDGAGTGGGVGTALGSGKGSGSAPGPGGFPGITIRGGNYGNGGGDLHPKLTPRIQTSYGMTITSTASSGGGLPDFGVFQNQKVYTVYLDMRSTDDDPAPSWTLQYAVQQPKADPNSGLTVRISGVPTPPYATLKQVPELSPELAAACDQKLIVVAGTLSSAGKLEQLSVKKSPDARVDGSVLEALSNWNFQPSHIAGNPVSLKVLLGIRLASR